MKNIAPIAIFGSLALGAYALSQRASTGNAVGALVAPGLRHVNVFIIAPAGPGASPPIAIPSGASSMSLYDSSHAGASVFANSTHIHLYSGSNKPVLRMRGTQLLQVGATIALPPAAKTLVINNGASPVGSPALYAVAIFHIG